MNFTYQKKERICSKILIDKLFDEGSPFYDQYFKVFWLRINFPENVPVQSLISVSKYRFRRTNKRNLIKRRIREAFRINKNSFYQKLEVLNTQIAMVIIYNTNTLLDYSEIEKGLNRIFNVILSKVSEKSDL